MIQRFAAIFSVVLFVSGCNLHTKDDIVFFTTDTDFSKGRIGFEQKIELDDLEKFHGHLCDGLVVGAQAMHEVLRVIYPNQPIDRTDLRVVSKSSPCLTDVAIYVSGGRYQFNTFYVDDAITSLYIVQRITDGQAYAVSLKPNVKPIAIDSLGSLAAKGLLSPCGLDSLRALEDAFTKHLLTTPSHKNYTVTKLEDFTWQPTIKTDFVKTDVVNKNLPRCLP